jgi:nitrite reductase (NADH) large subunit
MLRAIHRPTLLVLGTGMAGAKVVEEILDRAPDRFYIRMFGAEPDGTYNRILLSSVLAGKAEPSQLWLNPRQWYEERGIHVHSGVKADRIDTVSRHVCGAGDKVVEPYDVLIFATGSRPFVPPLENVRQKGVFVFRTLEDCASISNCAAECDHAVVLGGGLLGLEAARGLLNFGLQVTVVELANYPMVQQLDASAGALLQAKLEAMGVRFHLGAKATKLLGNGAVEGVQFADGSTIETDMVVISCGIQPNVEEARAAGLAVERGIVVDDQLRTTDPNVFAVGECAQHRGRVYGLVDPLYEQARILADVVTEKKPQAAYTGSRLATTLKVMGVDLISMGDIHSTGTEVGCVATHPTEVVSHLDSAKGVYKKFVIRDNKLVGAILLGETDRGGRFGRLFKEGTLLGEAPLELLQGHGNAPTDLGDDLMALPDETQICNCNAVSKGTILKVIKAGKCTVDAIGECTRAGTGCSTCQSLVQQLIDGCGGKAAEKNPIERVKEEKDGLDSLPDILKLASNNAWEEMTEDDKHRFKWHGVFFRKPTPGHFMLRIRFQAGHSNARQFRLLADVSDEFGKGFCDLTTRQQLQLRWFTLGNVPEIWRRLEDVGLHSKQTGMDNVRGICGCPLGALTPHSLLDALPVIDEFNDIIVDNREFTNLPRKFNVTITGCLENCTHGETQDISLVPAIRELDGRQVNGFNIHIGGKQGSGGYRPARALDVFAPPQDAAKLSADITRIFTEYGSRASRTRSRLAFLVEDRGIGWFRAELERRWGDKLHKAGQDMRKIHHVDHLGIHPQRKDIEHNRQLYYVGFLVPVGRITTKQMRAAADIAERYGNGDIYMSVGQNLIVPNIPEAKIGALSDEPIFKELPYDPTPIMRDLVCCTGNDYCGLALIDTKAYALQIAQELERRTAGRKVRPLSIHWSGCPAGCGMHQVSTIGLQGVRSRVDGAIVDAAHVTVNGCSGPHPVVASDLMYDVPVTKLAEALEPLVLYLPRK